MPHNPQAIGTLLEHVDDATDQDYRQLGRLRRGGRIFTLIQGKLDDPEAIRTLAREGVDLMGEGEEDERTENQRNLRIREAVAQLARKAQ